MPVARAWSLDAARRARLGFSGSKTKLAFWKSNVRASCAEAATSQQHATAIYLPAFWGKQSRIKAGTTNAKGHGIFSVPFRGL